jgi:hypothetical protein
MKKIIAIIVTLLLLIAATTYYGYTTIFVQGILTEKSVDTALGEIDTGVNEFTQEALQDDTVQSLEAESLSMNSVAPATIADIEATITELNSFVGSSINEFGTSLADL